MKYALALILLVPALALAGKAERDYKKAELDPKVAAAEAAYKTACGCSLKATVDEAILKSTNDMYTAGHIFESISGSASQFCSDAEAKKAICKMTSLTVVKGTTAGFKMEGSKGINTTDGQSFINFEMMSKQLDQ